MCSSHKVTASLQHAWIKLILCHFTCIYDVVVNLLFIYLLCVCLICVAFNMIWLLLNIFNLFDGLFPSLYFGYMESSMLAWLLLMFVLH